MGKVKTILLVVVLLGAGGAALVGLRAAKTYLSGAAAGGTPKNVRVQAEAKSATISWQTDKQVQAVVEYGTSPASMLLRALETTPTTTHRVVLSPLKPDTTYYFRIRVGEEIFDNSGIPYSFRTKTASGKQPTTPTPAAKVGKKQSTTQKRQVTPTPTKKTPGKKTKITSCSLGLWRHKFGTKDPVFDLDGNGIVNSRDLLLCRQQQKQ